MAVTESVSLEQRVAELESRVAIGDLVSDYAHGCDKRDVELFMRIWHSDALYSMGEPFGDFTGSDAIRHALVDEIFTRFVETHHWMANLVLEFDGPDRATGRCDVGCESITSKGQHMLVAASYDDVFERRNGEWRIARRDLIVHYLKAVPIEPTVDF